MKKPLVSFPVFQKLDLRIGKIVTANAVEKSNKLVRMEVDLGQDYGKRTIFGGLLLGGYLPEELIGKKFVFMANLEPRKMMNEESAGMIMAADLEGKPVLLEISEDLPEGTIVR